MDDSRPGNERGGWLYGGDAGEDLLKNPAQLVCSFHYNRRQLFHRIAGTDAQSPRRGTSCKENLFALRLKYAVGIRGLPLFIEELDEYDRADEELIVFLRDMQQRREKLYASNRPGRAFLDELDRTA